jgi:putative transcriptional regulator
MAIRIQLDRILLVRRMSLTELADRVGVTLANLSILKTGKARAIRFSTLDALCRELNCQPGDLLSHEPGPQDMADGPDGADD